MRHELLHQNQLISPYLQLADSTFQLMRASFYRAKGAPSKYSQVLNRCEYI